MKPGSNSVEVHPQLSHNKHPVDDGALVGAAGSLWLSKGARQCSMRLGGVFSTRSSSRVTFHQLNLLCFICSDKPIFEQ
jgi:hypothetical protein